MSHKLSNNLINYDTYDMLNCLKKISCSYSSRLEKFKVQEMYAFQNSCADSANFKFCAGNTIFNMEGLR